MGTNFSFDEVQRLVSLARSGRNGRTLGEQLQETLEGTRELVNFTSCNVFLLDPVKQSGELILAHGLGEGDLDAYVNHYRHHDPMGRFIVDFPDQVKTLSDAATPRQVDRTEFSELLGRIQIRSIAGWSRQIADGRYVAVGAHRERKLPDYEQKERLILDIVFPFLSAAIDEQMRPTSLEARLTTRERDVARLVAQGCADRDIAHELGITFATVRTHLQRAFAKAGVSNRTELALALADRQHFK